MPAPTTGTPPVGSAAKMWIKVGALPFDATSAQALEFVSENLGAVGDNYYNDAVRGTRSRGRERIRRVSHRVAGSIVLTPSYTELRTLLPLILGTAESGSGTSGAPYAYALAESLLPFQLLISRVSSALSGHTAAVFLYENCYVARATFSAAQGGPLTLTLEIVATRETKYTHGAITTGSVDTGNVLSSGNAVPSSSPDNENCWIFSDTEGDGSLAVANAIREAFDWSLSIDNALDTTRQMNSLYNRTFPALDRAVEMAMTLPFTTAEDDLFWPAVNSSSPDMNINAVTFASTATGAGAVTLGFTLGTWNIRPVTPTVGSKGEIVLPLSGPLYRKNSSTAKPELAVSMFTP